VIAMVILMFRRTSNPIVELSKARGTDRPGNFDVQLNFRDAPPAERLSIRSFSGISTCGDGAQKQRVPAERFYLQRLP
jgi:hypothetical protein